MNEQERRNKMWFGQQEERQRGERIEGKEGVGLETKTDDKL